MKMGLMKFEFDLETLNKHNFYFNKGNFKKNTARIE